MGGIIEYHQTKMTEAQRERNNGDTELLENKDKMAIENPHVSIITLNINGLNSLIKSHRVADWIKKQNPTVCCLQRHISAAKT